MPLGHNSGNDAGAVGLLPCPFCGSDNVSMSYWAGPDSPEPKGHFVECEECACGGPGVSINDPNATPSAEESAAEGWNARLTNPAEPSEAQIEAGAKALVTFAPAWEMLSEDARQRLRSDARRVFLAMTKGGL